MTHLPFILGAYGLTALVVGGFSLGAWLRLRKATRHLAAVDQRAP